jgi:hypothetical protein
MARKASWTSTTTNIHVRRGVRVKIIIGMMIATEFMAEHLWVKFGQVDVLNMSHHNRDHGIKIDPKASKQIGDKLLITEGMTRSSNFISVASHLGIIFSNWLCTFLGSRKRNALFNIVSSCVRRIHVGKGALDFRWHHHGGDASKHLTRETW